MGARLTRITTKRGQETQFAEFGDSKEKQIGDSLVNVPRGQARIFLANEYNNFSIQSLMEQTSKNNKHSLQELQMKSPPGFKAFESAVDLRALDEETALKLWEDIFKPLYTFEFEGEAKGNRLELLIVSFFVAYSVVVFQFKCPSGRISS